MSEQRITGIAASDGVAIGPAFIYAQPALELPTRPPEAPGIEIARFEAACAQAHQELQRLYDNLAARSGPDEAAIFEAHQMMLQDPMLHDKVSEAVEQGQIIEQAVVSAGEELAAMLAAIPDEMFAARAADVRDLAQRLLRILLGLPDANPGSLQHPAVIIARDLTPSDTASLDPRLALGFCTALGGLTSHSAILARSLGIPAVVAAGETALAGITPGDLLVLDGAAGTLVIRPLPETLDSYRRQQAQGEARRQALKARAGAAAATADGVRVEVAANIGDTASALSAIEYGAEGVGLLRTEFLYLEETQPPGEGKQLHAYSEILDVMQDRPVIIRTLDIGGDKPPAYLPFPDEMNPFLGWRAIRISLDQPDLFKTQVRAILRAAVGHNVRIMFPMIDDLDELRAACRLVDEAKAELEQAGVAYATDVPVGIMVETPAAAVLVDVLAECADFFSLGTNDLTQYTLAVDRGNSQVARLYQPLHPAVLRLVRTTIELAHARGKWVGMCGELAGMSKAIPILLGLGLDEFSMNPRAIPAAKDLIARLSLDHARRIAAHAMRLSTAAEIEAYMEEVLRSL